MHIYVDINGVIAAVHHRWTNITSRPPFVSHVKTSSDIDVVISSWVSVAGQVKLTNFNLACKALVDYANKFAYYFQ